jgi:flagellin-like hook-associated protein FlgL
MHYSNALADIKAEIDQLGYQVVNIWNTTQNRTKLPLSMFFVETKPAQNNKGIFLVEYLQ